MADVDARQLWLRHNVCAQLTQEEVSMSTRSVQLVVATLVFVVFAGMAVATQDKYTVQVPGGLAFSEFRGYEDWQVISLSHAGDLLAVILGNPEMIKAYLAGIPGNGKPFPDGAKMAKIHWNAKKQE